MHPLILLEGPDGAGKTTLQGQLAELYKARGLTALLVHLGKPGPLGAFDQCMKLLLTTSQYAETTGPVIIDRFHYGERIYGPVMRGLDTLGAARQRMLDRVLLRLNSYCVICLPAWETVRDNWRQRKGQEYVQHEDRLRQVYESYQRLNPVIPTIRHDYTHDSPEERLDRMSAVTDFLLQYRAGPGVGWYQPGVSTLLVGEQVNQRWGSPWPFVGAGGCSVWLAQLLDHAKVSEKALYWANAMDPDGRSYDATWLKQQRWRQIIAMGGVAATWCHKQGLDQTAIYHKVHHPQYHKRFQTHSRYPLLDLLATYEA